MNWNTHTVFAAIVCEYTTAASPNHNSVTVWDQRVMRAVPEHHHIHVESEHVEYYLTDLNKQLLAEQADVQIYFRWEHMSTIGSYFVDYIPIGSFKAPRKYIGSPKRQFHPGPASRTVNY